MGDTKPKREKVKKRWEEGIWVDNFRKKKKEGTRVSDNNIAATWWWQAMMGNGLLDSFFLIFFFPFKLFVRTNFLFSAEIFDIRQYVQYTPVF